MREFIDIKNKNKTENGWWFLVNVGEGDGAIECEVSLDDNYWELLTDKINEPDELIRRTFEFLLERESKESILKKFDLIEIKKYFPEYEDEIKKRCKNMCN